MAVHIIKKVVLYKKNATAWKITKDIILEMVMMRNARFAENLGMIDKFQEHD
jgi:hypothetical protein